MSSAQSRKVILYKLLKTLFLILVWACLGLFSEITGVTLQDLRERTNSDYEQIGNAASMRMAGYGAGALFGGLLLTKLKLYGDLVIAVCLTVAALICVAVAYSPYVALLYAEFAIQGVAETLIAIAGQQSLVRIWKDRVSGPMHILHCGYGAGSFLVPQIVKPFLSQRLDETASQFYIQNCLNQTDKLTIGVTSATTTNITSGSVQEDSHFEYGYIIVMSIILMIAGVFFLYFCCNRQDTNQSTVEEHDKEEMEIQTVRQIFSFHSCSPGHPWYAGIIFCFLFVWFYVAVGGQMVFANYLYSYTRDLLCLTKSQAANIQSTFWFGFTAGRFAGFIAAIWIPMKVLIFIEAGGNLISALVLYFNPSNMTVIWIFSCVSGFFVGPLYPSGIAWANRYITMTGVAYTITLVGGSLAGVSFTVAIGWFFEHKGPGAFMAFVLGYSALACFLAVCLHLVARTRGDKYEREEISEGDTTGKIETQRDSQL